MKGKKADFVERLQKTMQDKTPLLLVVDEHETPKISSGFRPGSYWKALNPKNNHVLDPTLGSIFYGPTDPNKQNQLSTILKLNLTALCLWLPCVFQR